MERDRRLCRAVLPAIARHLVLYLLCIYGSKHVQTWLKSSIGFYKLVQLRHPNNESSSKFCNGEKVIFAVLLFYTFNDSVTLTECFYKLYKLTVFFT